MSTKTIATDHQVKSSGSATPVWRLVFANEMRELWVGGRALILIILFTIMMSITYILLISESEMSLIPPKEMMFLILEASIAYGVFIGLINGADSISGERERATLEAMLLTPTNRRQIVIGKFFAAISPWPVTLALSIPYVIQLSQGDESLGHALLVGGIMGTFLATAFTGFGMLLSIWSNSNRTSLFISLIVYILLVIPTQFPWQAQVGAVGDFLQAANPMEGTHHFLEKVIVNNRSIDEVAGLAPAPIVFAIVVVVLLFQYAGPNLSLEGGIGNMFRVSTRRVTSLALLAFLTLALVAVPTMSAHAAAPTHAHAVQTDEDEEPGAGEEDVAAEEDASQAATDSTGSQETESVLLEIPLEIAIDLEYAVVKTGDIIEFNTVVTNTGSEETPDMIVAMNMVNLGEGEPVDPEDWSPERNQDVGALAPGEFAEQSWEINTILDGDYMVYMVVIPEPDGTESTSQPTATSGIHVTVEAFARGNPGGVVPLAIGMPVALIFATSLLRRQWRKNQESGGA